MASARRLRFPNPQSANRVHEFESLSPIEFEGHDQLVNKLKTLRPKKGGAPSQANRNYTEDRLDLYRGTFELGRYVVAFPSVSRLDIYIDNSFEGCSIVS